METPTVRPDKWHGHYYFMLFGTSATELKMVSSRPPIRIYSCIAMIVGRLTPSFVMVMEVVVLVVPMKLHLIMDVRLMKFLHVILKLQ